MTRHIVCALDGFDGANRALLVAGPLAHDLGVPLTLLHVLPAASDQFAGPPDALHPELELDRARALFDAARARLKAPAGVYTRVEFGSPVDELIRVGAEDATELLVLGARGRGGLASAVLGSVSRAVADRARCPVLVVPPAAEPLETRGHSVVCGVERPMEDHHVLEVAANLAERLDLPLHVVTADPTPMPVVAGPTSVPPVSTLDSTSARREQLLQDLAGAGVHAQLHLSYGAPDRALEQVASDERARMLVVGSRGRSVFRRLLIGSVSGRLTAVAECPVLVVSRPIREASAA
jgi:nucleotide-binding universal stress UspA family protein